MKLWALGLAKLPALEAVMKKRTLATSTLYKRPCKSHMMVTGSLI